MRQHPRLSPIRSQVQPTTPERVGRALAHLAPGRDIGPSRLHPPSSRPERSGEPGTSFTASTAMYLDPGSAPNHCVLQRARDDDPAGGSLETVPASGCQASTATASAPSCTIWRSRSRTFLRKRVAVDAEKLRRADLVAPRGGEGRSDERSFDLLAGRGDRGPGAAGCSGSGLKVVGHVPFDGRSDKRIALDRLPCGSRSGATGRRPRSSSASTIGPVIVSCG